MPSKIETKLRDKRVKRNLERENDYVNMRYSSWKHMINNQSFRVRREKKQLRE